VVFLILFLCTLFFKGEDDMYIYYYYYCVNMTFKDYVIFLKKKTMGSLLKKRNEDVGNRLI